MPRAWDYLRPWGPGTKLAFDLSPGADATVVQVHHPDGRIETLNVQPPPADPDPDGPFRRLADLWELERQVWGELPAGSVLTSHLMNEMLSRHISQLQSLLEARKAARV